MHLITIDSSPAQLRKLRKGQAVRIKKGTGFNLLVSPSTYNIVSRAFNKGKGSQVKLSDEELDVNRRASLSPEMFKQRADEMEKLYGSAPTMAGQGIFGKAFDRFLRKTGLNKITDPIGKVLKPVVKQGIRAVSKIGANTLGKFIPGADKIADRVADFAEDYLDNPSKYNEGNTRDALSNIGRKLVTGTAEGPAITRPEMKRMAMKGIRRYGPQVARKALSKVPSNPVTDVARGYIMKKLPQDGPAQGTVGTGFNRSHVGRSVAKSHSMSADMSSNAVKQRKYGRHSTYDQFSKEPLAPFSRGYGMYAGRQGRGIVGCGGGMLSHYMPPALVSQPYSANYQFSHFLPPQFQHFNNDPSGMGLYL
jgi:hypothetical protein